MRFDPPAETTESVETSAQNEIAVPDETIPSEGENNTEYEG